MGEPGGTGWDTGVLLKPRDRKHESASDLSDVSGSENELEQCNDYDQADQENDTDCTAEKLQHKFYSLRWM